MVEKMNQEAFVRSWFAIRLESIRISYNNTIKNILFKND